MKLIVAIIKPFKLEEVMDAALALGVHGMTATEVRGIGRQKGHPEVFRGGEYSVDLLPKVRVEFAVPDEQAAALVRAIAQAASTTRIGDGKIFVVPLDVSIRIRTDDRDNAALLE